MTFTQTAKNAAFAIGMFVFPIKATTPQEKPFDVDAHITAVQASWRNATKDDLK